MLAKAAPCSPRPDVEKPASIPGVHEASPGAQCSLQVLEKRGRRGKRCEMLAQLTCRQDQCCGPGRICTEILSSRPSQQQCGGLHPDPLQDAASVLGASAEKCQSALYLCKVTWAPPRINIWVQNMAQSFCRKVREVL